MLERFFARSAHSCCMGSHRRLPHIYPKARCLFLPWHLYGSLPQAQYPPPHHLSAGRAFVWMDRYLDRAEWGPRFLQQRSEEHTSELQSHSDLVCRLLLEKKKKTNDTERPHVTYHKR